MTQEQAVNRKARVGTVVSDKNDQTIVVEIERASRHRIYRKVIRQTKKYHVHDPNNEATRGDVVRIEECRPISKLKRFRLVEVLTERAVAEVAPEAIDQELVEEVQRSASRAAEEEAEAAAAEAPTAEATEAAPVAEAPAAEAPVAEAPAATDGDESSDDEQKAE